VQIPYSLKLLIQELQVMNVQMRIITDANIDQIASLGFSKNINNLMMDPDADLAKVAADTARALGTDNVKSASFAHLRVKTAAANRSKLGDMEAAFEGLDTDINRDLAAFPESGSKSRRKRGPGAVDYASMTVSEIERAVLEYGWIFSEITPVDGEVYASIVTDASGKPTEYWRLKEHKYQYPDRFPMGWSDTEWLSSNPIENEDKIAALKRFPPPVASNMERAYEHLLITRDRKYPIAHDNSFGGPASSESATGRKSNPNPSADTLNIGVLKHNEYAVNEARILDINKTIQQLELEIEDVKSKAVDGRSGLGSVSSSGSKGGIIGIGIAVGPTKLIETKLVEITKLQVERDELASKMALEREISQRAIEIMTSTDAYNSNSNSSSSSRSRSNSSAQSSYGSYHFIDDSPQYEASTPPPMAGSAAGGFLQQQQQPQQQQQQGGGGPIMMPMQMQMHPAAMMMPMQPMQQQPQQQHQQQQQITDTAAANKPQNQNGTTKTITLN
jgi:hypothetical protein